MTASGLQLTTEFLFVIEKLNTCFNIPQNMIIRNRW